MIRNLLRAIFVVKSNLGWVRVVEDPSSGQSHLPQPEVDGYCPAPKEIQPKKPIDNGTRRERMAQHREVGFLTSPRRDLAHFNPGEKLDAASGSLPGCDPERDGS